MWSLGFYGYGQKEADRELQGMILDTVLVNFAGIASEIVLYDIKAKRIWQILFLIVKS